MSADQSDQDEFDPEAFRDPLTSFFLQSVKDLATAEDLTQETLLGFWKSDEVFKTKKDAQTFLYRIARNQLKAHWRKKRAIPLTNEILDTFQSPVAEQSRETVLVLHQYSMNLIQTYCSPDDATLMTMKYIEQMTFKQIAAELGCSSSAASDRHQRILKQLHKLATDNPPPDFETGSFCYE